MDRRRSARQAIEYRLYENVNVQSVIWEDRVCRAIVWKREPTGAEIEWAQRIVERAVSHPVQGKG